MSSPVHLAYVDSMLQHPPGWSQPSLPQPAKEKGEGSSLRDTRLV